MATTFERLLPYTGVLAGVLFVVTMMSTYADEAGDPDAATIIHDHATQNTIAYLAMGLCCVALLFFAGAIRMALAPSSGHATVAFGAAVLVAASKAIDSMLMKAGLDAAEREDLRALDTLSYIGAASWLPWVAASVAFYLAVGLGGLATGALPRWLSIVTVVLGVACLVGPAGIAVYMATPVWFVVTGIVLVRRQRQDVADRVPEPGGRR
jgi:hypothetical protein